MANSLLSIPKAAERLGVAPITIRRLVSARKVSHHRIGGRIMFSEEDIAAFLAATRVEAVGGEK